MQKELIRLKSGNLTTDQTVGNNFFVDLNCQMPDITQIVDNSQKIIHNKSF